MTRQLKLLPPAKPRLGLYLRPGRNDHTVFLQLLAEGRAVSGVVLDARHGARHTTLREALIDNGVHAVLDSNFMELTTAGGRTLAGLSGLPWSQHADATAPALRSGTGRTIVVEIAEAVQRGEYSAVLAPTHFLQNLGNEFDSDREVAGQLRRALDDRGLRDVAIFYPLAIPASLLRDPVQRTRAVAGLQGVDIDAVWLRIHPFGTSASGPVALRRYIEMAWELQGVGVPLVGEHTGTVGMPLMALGAVGGIESGVTIGERFDATSMTRARKAGDKPFSIAPRVYLDAIGSLLSRQLSRQLFENRQMMAALGCKDPRCCAKGAQDMLKNPRRHFVVRRGAEVDRIAAVPAGIRAGTYVQDILRPAALLAVRAARVVPELEIVQRRLESWNLTLTAMLEQDASFPVAIPAMGQRVSIARHVPQAVK